MLAVEVCIRGYDSGLNGSLFTPFDIGASAAMLFALEVGFASLAKGFTRIVCRPVVVHLATTRWARLLAKQASSAPFFESTLLYVTFVVRLYGGARQGTIQRARTLVEQQRLHEKNVTRFAIPYTRLAPIGNCQSFAAR